MTWSRAADGGRGPADVPRVVRDLGLDQHDVEGRIGHGHAHRVSPHGDPGCSDLLNKVVIGPQVRYLRPTEPSLQQQETCPVTPPSRHPQHRRSLGSAGSGQDDHRGGRCLQAFRRRSVAWGKRRGRQHRQRLRRPGEGVPAERSTARSSTWITVGPTSTLIDTPGSWRLPGQGASACSPRSETAVIVVDANAGIEPVVASRDEDLRR